MEKRKRRRFTAEYKAEAAKRLEGSGKTLQAVAEELGVRGALFTADALHCQKNVRERRPRRQRPASPAQGQPARLA